MMFDKLTSTVLFRNKFHSENFLRSCLFIEPKKGLQKQFFRLCQSLATTNALAKTNPNRKLVKVALIGRTNSGKSTIINKILNLNICDSSKKTNTTLMPLKAAFVYTDTQIVFFDTPGLLTQKEIKKYQSVRNIPEWKSQIIKEVDVFAVVYEATRLQTNLKLHSTLQIFLKQLPPDKSLIFIVNKMDLIKKPDSFLKKIKYLIYDKESKNKELHLFQEVFFTIATTSEGLDLVINYLLQQAKPGEWLLNPVKPYDVQLHILIKNLLRAKVMNIAPNQMPFTCTYEVEYLEENELGQYVCVALITCLKNKEVSYLLQKKLNKIRALSQELESDLYKILGKPFCIRVVVKLKEKS